MPKLCPLPIETKGQHTLTRIWRWVTSVRKWELLEDWEYEQLDNEPVILIPKGFVFDGASIPRVLWGLLSPTGLLLIPGLIHDFAYRYDYLWAIDSDGKIFIHEEGAGRKHWDLMFQKVGLEVNGMPIIDKLAWLALALFGMIAWNKNRKLNAVEIIPDRYRDKPQNKSDNLKKISEKNRSLNKGSSNSEGADSENGKRGSGSK